MAQDESKIYKLGDTIVLDGGYEGICTGFNKWGQPLFTVDFGAPKYLDDLKTPINCQWILDGESYRSGDNKFFASVYFNNVNVMDKNTSASLFWSPQLKVGEKTMSKVVVKPILLETDPINENYHNNTLEWDLGDGIFRRIRLIEGMVIEYYVITNPLKEDLSITANAEKGSKFAADRPAYACDADGKPIKITVDSGHNVSLNLADLKDVKYPIIIDPDTTFESTSSDGWIRYSSVNSNSTTAWDTAHDAASGDFFNYTSTYLWGVDVDGMFSSSTYTMNIYRSFLFFDTSVLSGLEITNVDLKLYPYRYSADFGAWTLVVTNGQPTYPHNPIVAGDYLYTHYSGSGGTLASGSFIPGYNTITLNATGRSWINTTGITKLCLREKEHDIDDVKPTGLGESSLFNRFQPYAYEKGVGYRPQLVVTFTVGAPAIVANEASSVANTTARLNSTVTDDGGEVCQVRFGYGEVSQDAVDFDDYTTITDWSDAIYTVGNTPYVDVDSLSGDTTYYYRAQIKNSDSTVTSVDEIDFTTSNAISDVTTFYGISDISSISLSWVVPDGGSQVLVRYAYDTYPTAVDEGTQLYLGNLSGETHTGLASGRTVYYAIWGESGGNYSTTAATLSLTTIIGAGAADEITPPDEFGAPSDETGFSGLGIYYTLINGTADALSMPHTIFWMFGFVIITGLIAIFVYNRTNNGVFGLITAMVLIGVGMAIGILPLEVLILEVVLGLGIWAVRRDTAYA
jgi:hypothetical protein